MSAVDDIAERLIEAAYKGAGQPPEIGGEYIHDVTARTDVIAFFRWAAETAAGPRTEETARIFECGPSGLSGDFAYAGFVMRLAFSPILADNALPYEQRCIIEGIQDFDAWSTELLNRLANKAADDKG